MKKIVALFAFLLSLSTTAQFSKTHYIPPLSNTDSASAVPQGQSMYISCPSITPVNFQIQEIGGNTITGTVSRDAPFVYVIGTGYDTQLLISRSDVNTVKDNKGFIVQAEDLIYVTVRLTASNQNFQAGGLVSKGSAALGTQFRIGAFINTGISAITDTHYTFASILATENNTVVSFGDIKPGVDLINNTAASNTPSDITLNAGESYVIAVEGPTDGNRDGLIGASITSNKPIAVNCGSFAGTNGNNDANIDLGFDQIVSAERTGQEYIFVKGSGIDVTERPLLVANEDNTAIYLDGNATPYTTLNAGDYLALDGSAFSANGNLYVSASKNVFAYQGIGGTSSQANQNMHFLPPLSCQTPKTINNIPFINEVGGLTDFFGTVCIVTKAGASLDFIIDGTNYSLATLPSGINVNGPLAVTGNANYVTYTFENLTGNVSVFSSEQVYLSYYGSSSAATYGGYYSGFTFDPEIILQPQATATSTCIPFVDLQVNAISGFDLFQWYFNGTPITGATANTYTPTQPGFYKVKATLSACSTDFYSAEIPVSACAADTDNDGTNDNIDLDNDNDGITNCTESFGNQSVSLANTASGTITVGPYSNSFTGAVTTSATASPTPFTGNADGSFVTDIPPGKTNWVKYQMTFAQPISLSLEYVTTANATDLLDSNGEYTINSPINKTITVLNPDNQLLIDTNYDGFYESGVTQFSSFEIRFRLNNTIPLAAGTGTFKFLTKSSGTISFKHRNLSDNVGNKATMRLLATCIPKDSDNDGIPDQDDYDSDNDSILDFVESQGQTVTPLSNADTNGDGIDNIFANGITPADTDSDGIPNYLDLDADNDGIVDIIESGSPGNASNTSGIMTGNFGTNGLHNSLETSPDSGILNYTLADTDGDGMANYIDLDSDADNCNDATEGSINFIIAAPIIITTQPQNVIACELQSATFTITTNPVNSYQWQLSTDNGATWTTLTNNATYSGVTTVTLTISNVSPTMVGYQYRVFLNKNGNSCGLYSTGGILTTYPLPVITTPISLKQCDDNTDGISTFNLTQKNDVISSNYMNETFTYYTNLAAANTQNNTFLIANPIAFTTGNTSVYARVVNSNGCFRVARIDLTISVTQIPPSFQVQNQYRFKCDDYLDPVNDDRDGITKFDFTPITNSLLAFLPSNVSIKYYKTEADFLAETDAAGNSLAIPDPSNYRNIGFPGTQTIWIRVDSTADNSCFGFKKFDLVVESLPFAYPVNANNLIRHCDDNQDGTYGFDTSGIQAAVVNGQPNVNVKYFRANGTPLPSPLPNPFPVNTNETITIRVSNNNTQSADGPCYEEETLQFIVDDLPEVFPIAATLTTTCDDEAIVIDQDGQHDFDTTNFEATLLGTQTGMNVYYFDGNNNPLPSPLPNPFTSSTQNVKVVVENPINTACTAQMIIPFVVHPLPKIDQEETVLICLPDTQATLDAGIQDGSSTTNYSFQWYLNNNILAGQINPTLTVNTTGVYSVRVTNTFGCAATRVLTVISSQIASIQDIVITDLTEINSVAITVTGSGIYEYALDDSNGPYRDTGLFTNVPMGLHELYVRDKNGCGIIGPISVPVLGIPQYFTPNGDGYHDYWNVRGISLLSPNVNSIVYIFDRFGKLVKQLSPISNGWDGTYNGHELPADDYWYDIQFVDGRNVKGHFALKR
ncbi:T9SS type B sorting domain-containing protein [Flavobacterium phycosphaerae]|uniref:T9SS type B sorting domain-containing protein n=1 Tax=Flavobacterium phycosphaerae TaxID=2697515 RepID=UPI001389A5F2|nr:T9SS type B sorting domain-containing protein [Flavobacterium phycosphaerae]